MTDHAHVFHVTTRGGFEVTNSQSSLETEDKALAIRRHQITISCFELAVFKISIMRFHISIENTGSSSLALAFSLLRILMCQPCANQLTIKLQMERKQGGLLLRKDLYNLSFLQSYPEVQKRFSDAGCMTYVERLQEGYHQETAEIFSKSYDGRKDTVASLELIVDEASIASATSLPRTGQSWFKTTVTKNLDVRVYLKT